MVVEWEGEIGGLELGGGQKEFKAGRQADRWVQRRHDSGEQRRAEGGRTGYSAKDGAKERQTGKWAVCLRVLKRQTEQRDRR